MYQSNMRVNELIDLARSATDIAPDIDEGYYLMWLNSLEGLLYTGTVRELGIYTFDAPAEVYEISLIEVGEDEAPPRGCDISLVYCNGRELARVNGGDFMRHPERPCFFTDNSTLKLNLPEGVRGKVTVVYRRRPKPKGAEDKSLFVSLPDEFLPMALDYLVGCAYALLCQDNQAANRFAAYNAAMDDFVRWHENNKGGNK